MHAVVSRGPATPVEVVVPTLPIRGRAKSGFASPAASVCHSEVPPVRGGREVPMPFVSGRGGSGTAGTRACAPMIVVARCAPLANCPSAASGSACAFRMLRACRTAASVTRGTERTPRCTALRSTCGSSAPWVTSASTHHECKADDDRIRRLRPVERTEISGAAAAAARWRRPDASRFSRRADDHRLGRRPCHQGVLRPPVARHVRSVRLQGSGGH